MIRTLDPLLFLTRSPRGYCSPPPPPNLFFLCCSNLMNSIVLSSSTLILSALIATPLMSPPREIFSSVIVFSVLYFPFGSFEKLHADILYIFICIKRICNLFRKHFYDCFTIFIGQFEQWIHLNVDIN